MERAPHSFPEYNQRYLEHLPAEMTAPGLTLYVSQEKGSDANNGSQKDPFKTLIAARNAIRKLKKTTGLPNGGIQVTIGAGHYRLRDTLNLGKEDSGTASAPITWYGIDRTNTILSSGTILDASKFLPLDTAYPQERLHPKARGKLVSLDLSHHARLFGTKGDYRLLSLDGHLLQIAQWPNRGYHHIGEILDKGPTTRWLKPGETPPPYSETQPSGAQFNFREPLSPAVAREFTRTQDMRLEGYFHNDWYFQNERLGKISDKTVQLLRHTRYGMVDHIKGMPRRARLVNVLAELDEPGEWYYDRQEQSLYLWPIAGFNPATSLLVLPGGKPLVKMSNTSHVTLRNLTFENSGKLALRISGGEHNLIAGCTIRNGAGHGAEINGGKYNGITACEFYGLHTAFSILGGNISTLESCYHFATNNHIYGCRKRGYGLIGLRGVSIYFAHNLIHDMNGAVSFNTVDLLMEYNEYYNIGFEMGDFNVAYCGAKWHTMNNVLRYNFVHHLLEPGGHPIAPFRNDDGGAGLKIYGNVFYRAGRCAGQFHGPANDLQNNIALQMPIFWWTHRKATNSADIKHSWERLSRFGRELPRGSKEDYFYNLKRVIGEEGWLKSPWKEQYPILAQFIDTNPWAQSFCNVNTNYAYGVRKPFHIHGGSGTIRGMENKEEGTFQDLPKEGHFELPKKIHLEAFMSIETLDFRFKPSFQPMPNFQPIPFASIGLQKQAYRSDLPDKHEYRSKVYQAFKGQTSQGYQPHLINARYPTPSYLK